MSEQSSSADHPRQQADSVPRVVVERDVHFVWQRIREHKIIQWGLGYLAAALALTHAEELIARAYGWPDSIGQILIAVLAIGLPVAVTLAWYHGHRASRHVTGAEATIIAILLLMGSGFLWLLVRPHETSQTQSDVEYPATSSASSAVALAPRSAGLVPGPAAVMRFQVPLPEKTALLTASTFALSPDGRQLAFAASGPDGIARLWVRPLDSLVARPLPGAESRNLIGLFFWSPDSRFIAFDAVGKLKKVPVSGGPAETICDLNPGMIGVGGSWNRDGVIIFGQSGGGLMQVSAAGGTASPLTTVDRSRGEYHHVLPWFLPDGRHFIYSRQGREDVDGLYVGSLGAKQAQVTKRLIATETAMVAYGPTNVGGVGRLLFVRDGELLAQPFDPVRLELRGEPTPLAEDLALFLDSAAFHLSANGILVYRSGGVGSFQPTWYDRKGKVLGAAGEERRGVESLKLSPDGKWAAVSTASDRASNSRLAIWLLDFARGTSTRFTFGSSNSRMPVWSPDGSRIIFASDRGGHYDLYQKVANGGSDEELVLKSGEDKYPSSWSRDGRFLLYTVVDPKTGSDQWVLPLEGDRKPFPIPRTGLTEGAGQFSPDVRWVAYMSDESGRPEVYVRSFLADSNGRYSGVGGKWLISDGGGFFPHWRADGKELYYNDPRSRMVAVDVSANPGFKAGVPALLFPAPIENPLGLPGQWDVTPDGERFLISAQASQSVQAPFTVVLNWPALLNR
jgi:Tol biopolymer transport system component